MKQKSILQIFLISLFVFAKSEALARALRKKRINPWSYRGIAPVVVPAEQLSTAYDDPLKELNERESADSYNSYGKHHRRYQRPYKLKLGQHFKQDYRPTASEHFEVIPSAYNSGCRYDDQKFDRMLNMMLGNTDREEQKVLSEILYAAVMDGGTMNHQLQQQQQYQPQPQHPKLYNCGKCLQCKKCQQHGIASCTQCHSPKPLPTPILDDSCNCNESKTEPQNILLLNNNNNNKHNGNNIGCSKNDDELIFMVSNPREPFPISNELLRYILQVVKNSK